MSYKAEMLSAGTEDEWCANGLRFQTKGACDAYGLDLLMRWTGAADCRATVCDDPPTLDSTTVSRYEGHFARQLKESSK